MGNLFQLAMVKHMLTNKGFTLIETLFVLFIICMLSMISMTLHMPQKSADVQIKEIVSFLNEAKLNAMTYKQTVTLKFNESSVSYQCLNRQRDYELNQQLYFDNHQMTFNDFGNVRGAKTVILHTQNKNYHFVYQVGSGCFYVE